MQKCASFGDSSGGFCAKPVGMQSITPLVCQQPLFKFENAVSGGIVVSNSRAVFCGFCPKREAVGGT